jgi:eukaryotic-like serine/threonine-protein kinase
VSSSAASRDVRSSAYPVEVIADRYTLVREIGRGGMGAVWLARDQLLHRDVAMKRLRGGELDVERAAREARVAAAVNHPHVVAVFDLVDEDGERWLVMEYVGARTLAALVAEAPLPPERAAGLLAQAAEALAAAHAAGIVHRDVKPSNMLVTADDALKISDFGIARAAGDTTLTRTGMVTGSPAYLAPEVARGEPATPASDVWSLGATAYHALAGQPPYGAEGNAVATLYRVVHEDPPRLPGAGAMDTLLRHTMDLEPTHRWTTAQVHAFLTSLTTGEDPATTAVMTPVVAAATVAGAAEAATTRVAPRVRAVDPVPETPSPAATSSATRIHSWWAPLLAGAAVLVALLLAVLWLAPDESGSDRASSTASSSGAASAGASPSGSPSESPSESRSPTATTSSLRQFVTDYLATATSDQKASWEMLTPSFQAASGGYGSYHKFWKDQESATLTSFEADPDTLTVEYDVRYERAKTGTVEDHVRLQLVEQDGSLLITGES